MNKRMLQVERLKRDIDQVKLNIKNHEIRKLELNLDKEDFDTVMLVQKGKIESIRRTIKTLNEGTIEFLRARRDEQAALLELRNRELRSKEIENDLLNLDNQIQEKEERLIQLNEELQRSSCDFANIKKILDSGIWPLATPFSSAPKTKEEKEAKAVDVIIDLIDEELHGKKFLDFGCGEGYTVKSVSSGAKLAVGYDIVAYDNPAIPWNDFSGNNHFITTDIEIVKPNGPYDVVLLYDVLDHALDPLAVLSQVKELCHEDTKIYVRFHPWTSRDGAHIDKFNCAYLHLILDETELKELGIVTPYVKKITDPINVYNYWIKDFNIIDNFVHRLGIDSIFMEDESIRDRLNLPSYGKDVLQINYVDFVLKI